jgi:4-amino-4-deoxy-L-arabinose transferase-like glycosyltransferase
MTKRQFGLFLVGLAVPLAIFVGSLGRRHLYDSDEARFALLAQDIVTRGDVLLPRLREQPYMNKPPLFIWLIALESLPGRRVTEFTAQFPAALGAAGAVIGTALIGARLWGLRVGLVAALILGTSVGYVHHAGLVLTDMVLTCFMVLALYAFYTGIHAARPRKIAVGYGLVGLAVLSKGPAGLLALAPAAAAVFDRHGWKGWRTLSPLLGLGVLAVLFTPFALTYLTRGADQYLTSVWPGDYLAWVTGPTERPASPLFPLGSLFAGTLPWSLLSPLLFQGGRSRWEADEGTRWVVYWLGLMLVAFVLVAAKRTRYLLPLYPALALLLAERINSLDSSGLGCRWSRLAAALWIAGSGIAVVLLCGAGRSSLRPDLLAFLPESGVEAAVAVSAVIAGALLGGLLLWQSRILVAALTVGLSAASLLMIVQVGYPARYNAAYDMPELAARTRTALGPTDHLITYQYGKLSLDFYLERLVPEVTDPSVLRRLMAGPGRVLCVVEERRLSPDDAVHWTVLDRLIIGGRPILLVANRNT